MHFYFYILHIIYLYDKKYLNSLLIILRLLTSKQFDFFFINIIFCFGILVAMELKNIYRLYKPPCL